MILLLAIFTLMLVESVIVYSYPACYRVSFRLLSKCSQLLCGVGSMLFMLFGLTALASFRQEGISRQEEYLFCLAALFFMTFGFALFCFACASESIRKEMRERIESVSLARLRSYAALMFLINVVGLAIMIHLVPD